MLRSLLFPPSPGVKASVPLLLLRVVAGAAFMFHGWPKIQKPMSWMGEAGPHGLLQAAAAVSEFCGGACWIAGGLTALASLGLGATMAYAVWFHFSKGDPFVGFKGSYEPAAIYFCIAVLLLIIGPGSFSVDAFVGGRKSERK